MNASFFLLHNYLFTDSLIVVNASAHLTCKNMRSLENYLPMVSNKEYVSRVYRSQTLSNKYNLNQEVKRDVDGTKHVKAYSASLVTEGM